MARGQAMLEDRRREFEERASHAELDRTTVEAERQRAFMVYQRRYIADAELDIQMRSINEGPNDSGRTSRRWKTRPLIATLEGVSRKRTHSARLLKGINVLHVPEGALDGPRAVGGMDDPRALVQ